MAQRFASNGTLRLGGAVVANATDISIEDDANSELVITLAAEVGFSDGIATMTASVKNAVPRTSTERKAILRAYQNKAQFDLYYRSGDMEYQAVGIISKTNLASTVNKKDEFDFNFIGVASPVQDV